MNAGAQRTAPRRRWWVYLLGALGALAVLMLILLASAWIYWLSLIRTYTSDKPKPIASVTVSDERNAGLTERWETYARQFIHRREPIGPFELTGDDLNLFAARFGPLRNQAFIEIRPPHLRVQFSAPLDRTGNPRLQGRHLNGIATLAVDYANHQLAIRIVALEANGKPIPGWILRRLQATNWADRLNHRPEFDLAIRALERIELASDRLILHPAPEGP